MELTPEEVETEFWLHYYAENEGKSEEYEDEDTDFDELTAALEAGAEWEDVINE